MRAFVLMLLAMVVFTAQGEAAPKRGKAQRIHPEEETDFDEQWERAKPRQKAKQREAPVTAPQPKPQIQAQPQPLPVRICRTNEADAWTKLSIVLGLPSDGSPKEAANALMETLNTSGPSQHLIASLQAVIDFAKITKKAYELQLVKSAKAANDGFHAKVLKIVHDKDTADADVVIKGTELILEVAKQQLATGKKLTDDERKELATKAGLMAQMQNLEFATAVKERAFKSVLKLSKIEKEILAQHVSDFEKEAKISACEASFRHFIYN